MDAPAQRAPLHPDVEAAAKAVDEIRSRTTLPSGYLEFRLAVLRISRNPPGKKNRPMKAPPATSKEKTENDLRSGVPMLEPAGFKAEKGRFRETLNAIAARMKDAGVEGGAGLVEALQAEGDGRFDLQAAALAVMKRDAAAMRSLAEGAGVSASLLRFAVASALFPDLSPLAEEMRPSVDQAIWMRGYCPVCGAEPDYAELVREPEGARRLHCPACGMAWRFKRIDCPFCGNETHSTMALIFSEIGQERRISACQACKRYLKETDHRKLASGAVPNMAAEEMITLDLDLAAEARGFKN